MKFLIIGGGQDGLILSYLISNIEGVDGKLIIRKKNKLKKYYLNTQAIGSFTEQNIFSIIENIIDEYEPTHIINTAALSSTKECQKKPELAFNINTNFAIKLINLSNSKKFKLIHLGSTLENQDRPNCIYTKSKKWFQTIS